MIKIPWEEWLLMTILITVNGKHLLIPFLISLMWKILAILIQTWPLSLGNLLNYPGQHKSWQKAYMWKKKYKNLERLKSKKNLYLINFWLCIFQRLLLPIFCWFHSYLEGWIDASLRYSYVDPMFFHLLSLSMNKMYLIVLTTPF